jgi:bifunctional UDP-N-acetylglucosamine pyrophosphorylase/glucosamine-1-phosphate N-acetyltransferase
MESTDMVTAYAVKNPVTVISSDDRWIPIQYPWHLLDAAEHILSTMDSQIDGTVEEGAVIKGKLMLGKNSTIKAGAYIEGHVFIGENCEVGPNCYIRKFASIGNDCVIGHAVEIKGSVLGDNTKVPHLSYVPDSVLGNNVNYAGGTITANLKHDHSNVNCMVNGELVDTGRSKFGTVIGDNAKLGIHTIIYPGRKIDNDKSTLPGDIVKEDIA